jgi:membrane-bound ClpP family serine protease
MSSPLATRRRSDLGSTTAPSRGQGGCSAWSPVQAFLARNSRDRDATSVRFELTMTELGIAILLIGATLVAIETHVASLGMLAGPGALALGTGAVLAVSGLGGGIVMALLVAVLLAAGGLAIAGVAVREGSRMRHRKVRAGPEGLVGRVGVVQSWGEPNGRVRVAGALWQARRSWADEEDGELHAGDAVVVERLSGLTLAVRRAEEWELAP